MEPLVSNFFNSGERYSKGPWVKRVDRPGILSILFRLSFSPYVLCMVRIGIFWMQRMLCHHSIADSAPAGGRILE